MIIWSQHHDVEAIVKSQFEMRMLLTIRNLQKHDVGTYKCVAKNSLGDVESSIRLYGEFELIAVFIFNPNYEETVRIHCQIKIFPTFILQKRSSSKYSHVVTYS